VLALKNDFEPETWLAFRGFARALVRDLIFHIQKEETSLLPAIEDALDAATDQRLAAAYRYRNTPTVFDKASTTTLPKLHEDNVRRARRISHA
jgi:hypothetical protein